MTVFTLPAKSLQMTRVSSPLPPAFSNEPVFKMEAKGLVVIFFDKFL